MQERLGENGLQLIPQARRLGLGALLSSPAPAAEFEARVIVKLKAASPLKQAQAASRVRSLGARLGVSARMLGQPAPDLQVMHARGISSEALAARLGFKALREESGEIIMQALRPADWPQAVPLQPPSAAAAPEREVNCTAKVANVRCN